ncbi:MAG: outer membrane protein assembly factor BamD [Candidatus Cloacimonadales bacterium]
MKKLVLLLVTLLALIGCSNNLYEKLPDTERYKIANNYFDKGKYKRAIPIYESIVSYKTSGITSDAQAKLAESYYLMGQYENARLEYQFLMRYSSSLKDLEIAYFRIGECFWKTSEPAGYTQDETEAAISAMEEYLVRYPTGQYRLEANAIIKKAEEKLLEKTYLNGYTYFMLSDYPAALLYFDEVLAEGTKSEIDLKSAYYCAIIFYEQKNFERTDSFKQYMQLSYPDAKLTKKISKKLK